MRYRINHWVLGILLAGGATFLAGCGGSETTQESDSVSSRGHHHEPPHGGAPVVLGDESFHIEFVLDATEGLLQAYVLDAHMETFVRIGRPELPLVIVLGDRESSVSLAAVANPDTGETVGDTAQFEAKIPELVGVESFDGTIPEIEIRGVLFEAIRFAYPEGNEVVGHSH